MYLHFFHLQYLISCLFDFTEVSYYFDDILTTSFCNISREIMAKYPFCDFLKYFFSEIETKSFTFAPQCFCKVRIATIKDCYLPMVFISYLLESFFPIRPSGMCFGFQPCCYISIFLQ